MPKKMIVFTTSWCGDCRRLKAQLKDHQIPYEERDIEQNGHDYQTMLAFTKGKRVIPTVDIEGKILINPSFSQVADALKDSGTTWNSPQGHRST
jgi:glutaredoxin